MQKRFLIIGLLLDFTALNEHVILIAMICSCCLRFFGLFRLHIQVEAKEEFGDVKLPEQLMHIVIIDTAQIT